jgi:hypothetical protein
MSRPRNGPLSQVAFLGCQHSILNSPFLARLPKHIAQPVHATPHGRARALLSSFPTDNPCAIQKHPHTHTHTHTRHVGWDDLPTNTSRLPRTSGPARCVNENKEKPVRLPSTPCLPDRPKCEAGRLKIIAAPAEAECNWASLRGIEAKSHPPGWRICGFCRKLRRGRIL